MGLKSLLTFCWLAQHTHCALMKSAREAFSVAGLSFHLACKAGEVYVQLNFLIHRFNIYVCQGSQDFIAIC